MHYFFVFVKTTRINYREPNGNIVYGMDAYYIKAKTQTAAELKLNRAFLPKPYSIQSYSIKPVMFQSYMTDLRMLIQ
jgi:hypothetical protein